MSTETEINFETGMAELEKIVQRLESGELSLEDALRLFEEGVRLVRDLNAKLNQAEKRIEVLTRGEDGSLELKTEEEE